MEEGSSSSFSHEYGHQQGHYQGHYHSKPSLKELCRHSEAILDHWKDMALELDLPWETINRINRDNILGKDKCFNMFYTWLERSPDPCWCQIVEAIKKLKLLSVAKNIEEEVASTKKTIMLKKSRKRGFTKQSRKRSFMKQSTMMTGEQKRRLLQRKSLMAKKAKKRKFLKKQSILAKKEKKRKRKASESDTNVDEVQHVTKKIRIMKTEEDTENGTQFIVEKDESSSVKLFEKNDVEGAFLYLLDKLEEFWDKKPLSKFQKVCLRDTRLPPTVKEKIKTAPTLSNIITILTNTVYCTWIEIRILDRMANVAEDTSASNLIKVFQKTVYSKPFIKVARYVKKHYIHQDHVAEVTAKLNKDARKLLVQDLVDFCNNLEGIMQNPPSSTAFLDGKPGCLEISMVIPMYCYLHAYEIAKHNGFKLRQLHFRYVQIGSYPKIYAVNSVGADDISVEKIPSTGGAFSPSQVISHYYTFLEGHMDADSVSHVMLSKQLITDDEYEIISTAPNDRKMNSLILQFVKSMNISNMLKFCDILKDIETQKSIGQELENSLQRGLQHSSLKIASMSGKMKWPWTTSQDLSHVHLMFFDLVDELFLYLLSSEKLPFDLFTVCLTILASKIHDVPLFSKDYLKKMKYPHFVKLSLLLYMNWLDHSLLKMIVSSSKDQHAIKLVNDFDLLLDKNKPIIEYPIPEPSQFLVPLYDSDYTLVATKCCWRITDATLQQVIEIKSLLVSKWDISECSIQLVALHVELNYLYWLIPKTLVQIIQKQKLKHEVQQELHKNGIIITVIFPSTAFTNKDDFRSQTVAAGPFWFLTSMMQSKILDTTMEFEDELDLVHKEVIDLQKHIDDNIKLKDDNIKLKDDNIKLKDDTKNYETEVMIKKRELDNALQNLKTLATKHEKDLKEYLVDNTKLKKDNTKLKKDIENYEREVMIEKRRLYEAQQDVDKAEQDVDLAMKHEKDLLKSGEDTRTNLNIAINHYQKLRKCLVDEDTMGTLVMDNNSVTHMSSLPSTSGLPQVSNVTVTRVDSPQLHYQTTENVTYTRSSQTCSLLQIFKKYYSDLVTSLPMNDTVFLAKLYSNDLLPGGMQEIIKSIPTASQRTAELLDNVIKPTINSNDGTRLGVLLEVMKDSEDDNLRRLASTILSALREGLINAKTATGLEEGNDELSEAKLVGNILEKNQMSSGNTTATKGQQLVVDILHDNLSDTYKETRYKPVGAEWPPNQPKVIVSVALVHYKGKKTKQELFQIANRHKEGAPAIDKLVSNYQGPSAKRPRLDHSRITKDITDIFAPDPNTNELPTRILIEGAPGIGKTVLAKEIAYCWANNTLLNNTNILFLLILRDPALQKVENTRQLIQYVSMSSLNNEEVEKCISQLNSVKLGFVLDGFDEYPSSLQRRSYIVSIINGEVFPNSIVVITSRPTATISLHDRVDRRIDILGFAKEEREEYILQSLDKEKKEELDKYLKQKPTINTLCFIPLHLAVLLYLFQQGSLPETLTEMNESFIIHTIYRHLKRHELTPFGVVDKLDKVPKPILDIVYKLAKLAFKGLQQNKLIFTLDEIKEACPNISNMLGAINGFGLLQAVQHYPQKGAGETTSFNFLHYTMQEYLAAQHVTTLPNDEQVSLMEKTFWDSQFNFMWMMYVGIVGVKAENFVHFISKGKVYKNKNELRVVANDKRKRLHVFQCFMEAKSTSDTPEVITSMFKDGKVTLDKVKLLPHHISSLTLFISTSSMAWKVLQLRDCHIGDIGMSVLEQFVGDNIKTMSTLNYFDFTNNPSSPWGVYCTIIRHCSSNSLTLCGDDGMEEHVDEIIESLQANVTLQSFILEHIGINGMKLFITVLSSNTTLTKVGLLWTVFSSKELIEFLEAIKYNSNLQEICLTHNNVTKLDLNRIKYSIKNLSLTFPIHTSWNEITNKYGRTTLKSMICTLYNNSDDGSDDIEQYIWTCKETFSDTGIILLCDCIKEDKTTQELNMSYNNITSEGAKCIAEAIKVNTSLHTLNICQYISYDDELSFNMTILTAVHHNTTLMKLRLPWVLGSDNKVKLTSEVEKINKERTRQDISTLTCHYPR